MNNNVKATLYLVDDDPATAALLRGLVKASKATLASYTSGAAFLAEVPEQPAGCLLLKFSLPEQGGLEVMKSLRERHIVLPTIFFGERPPLARVIEAIRAGALDFLEIPLEGKALGERIRQAMTLSERWHSLQEEYQQFARRFAKLTPRERQVMALLASGKKNKMVAAELGISPKTLDIHRGKVMSKLEARTLADLARWTFFENPEIFPTNAD